MSVVDVGSGISIPGSARSSVICRNVAPNVVNRKESPMSRAALRGPRGAAA